MTDRHLALVRFVTARQPELRGLREVAFSALVCAVITLLLWRRETGRQVAWLILLGLFILVQEVVTRVVDWRYDSTYGRVNPAKYGRTRTTVAQWLLATGVALDVFTPWFPVAGMSAFPIVVASHGMRIAFRDFPWRLYWLGAVAFVLAAPAVDDPSRISSYLPAYFVAAACLTVTGFLDHLLLAVAMARLKQRRPMTEATDYADRASQSHGSHGLHGSDSETKKD